MRRQRRLALGGRLSIGVPGVPKRRFRYLVGKYPAAYYTLQQPRPAPHRWVFSPGMILSMRDRLALGACQSPTRSITIEAAYEWASGDIVDR